jgi:hypothetical protein
MRTIAVIRFICSENCDRITSCLCSSSSFLPLIEDEYFLNLKHNLYPFHYETILEIYRERKKRKLDLVILNEGIGSGKNYLAATLEWLEWYYYITTPDRKKVWPHIDPNTTTAFILLSKTERESRKIVFEYVFRLFQSKFNREYFPPDTKTTTSLKIPRSKTLIFPGTGEAASALGYNVYSGIVDEASYLQKTASKGSSSEEVEDQAQAMYNQLHGRIYSRFGHRGGLLVMITSANKVEDYVEQKIRDAIKYGCDRDRIFYKRVPFWKAKPAEFFPTGKQFLFNAVTFEVITDEEQIKDYMKAREVLGLENMKENHVLSGLVM